MIHLAIFVYLPNVVYQKSFYLVMIHHRKKKSFRKIPSNVPGDLFENKDASSAYCRILHSVFPIGVPFIFLIIDPNICTEQK